MDVGNGNARGRSGLPTGAGIVRQRGATGEHQTQTLSTRATAGERAEWRWRAGLERPLVAAVAAANVYVESPSARGSACDKSRTYDCACDERPSHPYGQTTNKSTA